MLSKAAVKRMIEPSELGEFVKFLCSDSAASIYGSCNNGWWLDCCLKIYGTGEINGNKPPKFLFNLRGNIMSTITIILSLLMLMYLYRGMTVYY